MQRTDREQDDGPVTEMAIVNTFTKLIFGDESYSPRELFIIETFRAMDANALRDARREMGEYLRSLGVREMIQLVSRLRQFIEQGKTISQAQSVYAHPAMYPARAEH